MSLHSASFRSGDSGEPFLLPVRRSLDRSRSISFAPCRQRRWKVVGILAVMLVVMVLLPLSTITASLWSGKRTGNLPHVEDDDLSPKARERSETMDFDEMAKKAAENWPRESVVRIYHQQAVAADVAECSEVGNAMLQAGGSAADAVIAAALCAGVVHPYSSGLGGGALILYYERTKKSGYTIDAREVAPSLATEDMYVNVDNNTISPVFGWHSIAVPGELAGMWQLHQRSGKLPWKDLFQPAIKRAREGIRVTPFFARILAYNKKYLVKTFADSHMRRLLISNETGDAYAEGDVIAMPALADTLEVIANDPAGIHEFYNGSIARKVIDDIQAGGGIMKMDDLAGYHVHVRDPISSKLPKELTLFGHGLPSGNVILHHIFGVMKGYNYSQPWSSLSEDEKVLFYHRFVEALKYGYASRSFLSDDQFVPGLHELVEKLLSTAHAAGEREKISDSKTVNDPRHYGAETSGVLDQGGTAHISVIDKDGNAVAYSTSINTIFGSYRISKSTGMMLNNHMDDFKTSDKPNYFGVAPSRANKIEPGKRPQSSICPLIITDSSGDVKIVAGGSGGTRIISGLMNVLMRVLFFDQDLKSALDAPRLHHQLIPMDLEYEKRFNKTHIEGLVQKGHKAVESKAPYRYVYSAVEVIVVDKSKNEIHAVSDGRKGGLPDGI